MIPAVPGEVQNNTFMENVVNMDVDVESTPINNSSLVEESSTKVEENIRNLSISGDNLEPSSIPIVEAASTELNSLTVFNEGHLKHLLKTVSKLKKVNAAQQLEMDGLKETIRVYIADRNKLLDKEKSLKEWKRNLIEYIPLFSGHMQDPNYLKNYYSFFESVDLFLMNTELGEVQCKQIIFNKLKDTAQEWWRQRNSNGFSESLDDCLKSLRTYFMPQSAISETYRRLNDLKQSSMTAREYAQRFLSHGAYLKSDHHAWMALAFFNGLNSEIRERVRNAGVDIDSFKQLTDYCLITLDLPKSKSTNVYAKFVKKPKNKNNFIKNKSKRNFKNNSFKKQAKRAGCFACGELNHRVRECPKVNAVVANTALVVENKKEKKLHGVQVLPK
ncbi:hypothetical protein HMI56_005056 [Coelomomyces lativittatus]|nr:hypothetical protein HMI56_005056 [Coelomomyces lativittatus]